MHVLAQVRFSRVFELAERMGAIKAKFEEAGFPRYEESQIQSILFGFGGSEPAKVQATQRWDFLDATKTRGVVLTNEFVLLHTNLYDCFEEFSQKFDQVLKVIGETAGTPFVERIGLRYVDLIQPRKGETASDYLKPGLVGFPVNEVPELQATVAISSTETRIVTSVGQLAIRCFQRNDGSFLPPDLWPSVLHYPPGLPPGVVVTILDFDHSAVTGFPYNAEHIIDVLGQLHDGADIAFRGAVTPHALTTWGQELI